MDYNKKSYKIAIFAIIIALLALAGSGVTNNFYNNSSCNCSLNNGTWIYGLSEINITNGFLYTYNGTIKIEHTPGSMIGIATNLDMEGNNITNCDNCQQNLNAKVNKSGDTLTGVINGTISQTINELDIAGGASILESRNSSTGYSSTLHLEPTNMYLEVTNGTSNSMLMDSNITTFQGNVSLDNHSLLNCANCVTTNSDLINETNISSATSWINISIPESYQNRYGYDIQIYVNNTAVSTITYKMYVNNLLTDANYRSQFTIFNGATMTSSRDSVPNIMTASSGSESFAKIFLGLSPGMNLVVQSETSRLIGTTGIIREQYYNTYITPISTIANVSINSPTANGIGAGSTIRIFKVKLT